MKVLLVNGSPHKQGCTFTALSEIASVLTEEGIGSEVYWIGNNPKKPFENDLSSFRHEAIISCPAVLPSKLKPLISLLQKNEIRNLYLITQLVDAYKTEQRNQIEAMLKEISEHGVQVLFEEKEKKKFAVFDRRVIWYGNVSFYGFTPKEAAVLRIENTDLAEELIKPYELRSSILYNTDDPPKLF